MAELSGNLLYAAFLLYLGAVFFLGARSEAKHPRRKKESMGVDRRLDYDLRICMPTRLFYREMDRVRSCAGQQPL